MRGRLNVLVDLDDTLMKTHEELVRLMKRDTGYEFKGKGFLTNENTDGNLQVVLDKAEFMYTAKPNLDLVFQLQKLRSVLGDNINIGFCTHRDYHPYAMTYTNKMLKRLSHVVDLEFFDIHWYLSPSKQPNKIAVIEKAFPGEFIILDDNPKFSPKDDVGDDPRVMIYTQEWNKHMDVDDSLRVNHPTEFLSKLINNPIFKERFNGRSEVQQLL